jgi:hypothetical protein
VKSVTNCKGQSVRGRSNTPSPQAPENNKDVKDRAAEKQMLKNAESKKGKERIECAKFKVAIVQGEFHFGTDPKSIRAFF